MSRCIFRAIVIVLLAAVAAVAAGRMSPASAEATLLVDVESGKVLQAENATYPWYPASVTKLMTVYVTLRAIKSGRITLDTPFAVSGNALAQAPTKMGFKVGTVVTVDNALKMLMVKSANDMAVLLAEGVSGSIDAFCDEMNANARRLGMTQTSYVNPNGLPADGQITSARDLAILARALIREFPEYDYFWHLPGIRFGHRVVRNYNKLLELYPGADGMKTGFICASGFNLVATATRNNRRLIAVVLGAPSASVRAYKAAKMLEQGFTSGTGLSWLMPSMGTVDQLPPIDASPPNLRDEMCGPHRKRPAAEDEEVELNAKNGTGDSPMAFVLSSLRNGGAKASALIGSAAAALPPVDVFVGAIRPATAAAAAAQEAQLAGGGKAAKRPNKKGKPKKNAKTAGAAAAPVYHPDSAGASDGGADTDSTGAGPAPAAATPATRTASHPHPAPKPTVQ